MKSEMHRKNKIIIIGARGFTASGDNFEIDCFNWNELGKIKNISDYDSLILNLISVNQFKDIDWPLFSTHLDAETMIRILAPSSQSQIVILGDPRFSVVQNKNTPEIKSPFLYWTGFNFTWDNSEGDTVVLEKNFPLYGRYLSKLTKWLYSFLGVKETNALLPAIHRYFNQHSYYTTYKTSFAIDTLCRNRYNKPLSFILRIYYEIKTPPSFADNLKASAKPELIGSLVFLPNIASSQEEALTIIIEDLFRIKLNTPEPQWVSEIIAPGQEIIDPKISRLEESARKVNQRLQEVKNERIQTRNCLKLLYSDSTALEEVVRQTLRKMKAKVEDPPSEERSKEDGWIVVKTSTKTLEGVLEIKGTTNPQFNEEGRKQLHDWKLRGIELRRKEYKGIFVGNSSREKPLSERPNAFSRSWVEATKLQKIVALKTEDIYYIYWLYSHKKLTNKELEEFWVKLFETDGIFDASLYRHMYETEIKKTSSSPS